jgi:hypothetical protein
MMHNLELTPDTVMIYAVKAYEKPTYIKSELADDLKHFSYLRRLFRRYNQYGELRERLILNHLIIVYNIFGVPAATRLLFYHTRPEDYAILKTFLVFLDKMPDCIYGINGSTIESNLLVPDPVIVQSLRAIRQQTE